MLGTHPVYQLAPLEYRYALDAAASLLSAPRLYNQLPALSGEIAQRFAVAGGQDALWVEPQKGNWHDELAEIAVSTPSGAWLVVIASLPLARLITEAQSWAGQPLGKSVGGVQLLRRGLGRVGFKLETSYGLHSLSSIALNSVGGRVAARRPALADSLHFRARQNYRTSGPLGNLATVTLLVACKERDA